MPPKHPPKPPGSAPSIPKKRKDAPNTDTTNPHKKPKPNDHRAKQRDARHLPTQSARKAFPANGALDVDKFVKAREYEIRALEQGIRRSKGALNRRAFQQVPKELRRRGAAHDVRKVVKRLRGRAAREMIEDGAVGGKKGSVGKRRGRVGWLRERGRVETVKKLRAIGERRKRERGGKATEGKAISTRSAKVKTATLANPPTPKAKFRKRQQRKSWLPTHLFHAKRAHMTPPSAPMWRFALPLSPTQKSYRPTHRASSERGAVCWDTSYMATIGLEGEERSVLGMLRALGVEEGLLSGVRGTKWRRGTRVSEVMVYEREGAETLVAPVTGVWCATQDVEDEKVVEEGKSRRKMFLRVHPSAFLELWGEVDRLAKVAKPAVKVEDLRWELGSIELKGPGSTEALLGALWPSSSGAEGSVEKAWTSLTGLTNAAMLPSGAMLAFSIQDPRLHFPPRTVTVSDPGDAQTALFKSLADWPVDHSQQPPAIFNRKERQSGSKLPSQKAVNRRKALAKPGEYPGIRPDDTRIPILLYASTFSNSKQHQQTSWHLLAPWKAIQPIWYSLIYYPVSTGQQPRFGGLNEQRQLAFEAGTPWFPGDFPGTKAGWEWEVLQRRTRWEDWKSRPRGKRVTWESVQVGEGKEGRGEIGLGWACEWELLIDGGEKQVANDVAEKWGSSEQQVEDGEKTAEEKKSTKNNPAYPEPPTRPKQTTHLPSNTALTLLSNPSTPLPANLHGKLITIHFTLLIRGTPQPCARIYRLPSPTTHPKLRAAWLALHPRNQPSKKQKQAALPRMGKNVPPHVQQQRLAASLLEPPKAGGDQYPLCPGKEDLVGFVTSGGFNLAEGRGTGVGCVMFERVLEQARMGGDEGRLCIVRNAGEGLARLGVWNVV